MKTAIWFAEGTRFIEEARRSALSVDEHMPMVTRILLTSHRTVKPMLAFDEVINIPLWQPRHERFFEFKMWNMYRLLNGEYGDYEKLLVLDSDTYFVKPVSELFDMLDIFSLLATHSPARYTGPAINKIPDAFPEINGGILSLKQCPETISMWQRINELIRDHPNTYHQDQNPIRDALWESLTNNPFPFYILPPEYNVRFEFGGFIGRGAKIIHGRSDNIVNIAKKLENVMMYSWKKGEL